MKFSEHSYSVYVGVVTNPSTQLSYHFLGHLAAKPFSKEAPYKMDCSSLACNLPRHRQQAQEDFPFQERVRLVQLLLATEYLPYILEQNQDWDHLPNATMKLKGECNPIQKRISTGDGIDWAAD